MSILYEKILKLLASRITSDYIDIIEIISILWPPDAKSRFIGRDPDDGKDGRQEEKGTTEDEMVGWHHQLNGCEFEQAPGDGEGQGSLVCCSPWGCKESDTTEQLNKNKNQAIGFLLRQLKGHLNNHAARSLYFPEHGR